jgi:hypothetical protein
MHGKLSTELSTSTSLEYPNIPHAKQAECSGFWRGLNVGKVTSHNILYSLPYHTTRYCIKMYKYAEYTVFMQYSCIIIHYLDWINSNRQLLDMQRWKPRKPHAQPMGIGMEWCRKAAESPRKRLEWLSGACG